MDFLALLASGLVARCSRRVVRCPALQLPHPSYPNQFHTFEVVEIGSLDRPVRFAVGELSNGVWGFYVPTQSSF